VPCPDIENAAAPVFLITGVIELSAIDTDAVDPT